MAGKYECLAQHLVALQTNLWQATFHDVETVLGTALPASARKHAAWWSNDAGHSQAAAWMNAGWRTRAVDIQQRTVVFYRQSALLARTASEQHHRYRSDVSRSDHGARRPVKERLVGGDATTLILARHCFRWFARIETEAAPDGKPLEFMPQERYAKAKQKPLNPNGHGPFCRFPVPRFSMDCGVYVVTVDRQLAYVGKADKDLRQRWRGYACIQPANCYRGGQTTNCKVNNAILLAAREDRIIDLWIHETDEPRSLEVRLIGEFDFPWNDRR